MELFEMVFKPETIHETLFLDIKVVAEYATASEFAEKNPKLHTKWTEIANIKYGFHDNNTYHTKGINFPESDLQISGLTTKDKKDLSFVARMADVVNLSFVNHASDVQDYLKEINK